MRRSKIVNIAKKMPPMCHKFPDQPYDVRKSHVVKWMLKHDETLEYIWNAIKQSGAVVYDSKTHTWRGVDHK